MKNVLITITAIFVLFSINSLSVNAMERQVKIEQNVQIEYLEDGSYFITEIQEITKASKFSTLSSSLTKSKTSTYYDSKGKAAWSVTVTGTFTYGNGTSKCISSSVSAQSYNNSVWVIASSSSSKSGNITYATASSDQFLSGQYLQTITRPVSLTCNSNGQVS